MKRTGVNEATYTLWTRNRDFERIDIIEDWQDLTIDYKWGDMSTWSLTLPTAEFMKRWGLTGTLGSLLTPNLTVDYANINSINTLGIIIFRNDHNAITDNIFSGVVTEVTRDWNGYDDTITLTGEEDTYYLRTRMCLPDPTHWFHPTYYWWMQTPDGILDTSLSFNGWCLEDTIRYAVQVYATDEIFNTTYVPLPYLQVNPVTYGRGDIITYQGRFQNLFTACQDMLGLQPTSSVQYSFRIRQVAETGDNRIMFNFDEPIDRSDQISFDTEMGTIKSYSYNERLPEFNALVIGGNNWWNGNVSEASRRIYASGASLPSMEHYGRIHGFVDYTSSGVGEDKTLADMIHGMENQGRSSLYLSAINHSVTIELEPEYMNQYGVDWQLGDLVTIGLGKGVTENGNWAVAQSQYIREITIDATIDGEKISVTAGDPQKFMRTGGRSALLSRQNQSAVQRRGQMW
jgi:Siphovirus ReqiPepy6 Gp37-like protein